MKIISLRSDDKDLVHQAAHLLVEAFREHWPDAWPTFEDGLEEVQEMLESERICRAVLRAGTGHRPGISRGL